MPSKQCRRGTREHTYMCAPSTPAHVLYFAKKKDALLFFFTKSLQTSHTLHVLKPYNFFERRHLWNDNVTRVPTTNGNTRQDSGQPRSFYFQFISKFKKKEKRREYLNFYAHGSSNSSVLCEKETPTVVQYRCPSSVQLVVGYTLVTMQFPCQQDLA